MSVPRRICVCTSYAAVEEPRAVRHAVALAGAYPEAEVVLLDCAPAGVTLPEPEELRGHRNLRRVTHRYGHRRGGLVRLAVARARKEVGRRVSVALPDEWLPADVLSARTMGFERALRALRAEAYYAHNVDTLLPAYRAARRSGARLLFDSMEFHSEMGHGQSAEERALVRRIERLCLPACDLVTTSSDRLSDALQEAYGLRRPLALYNMPPLARTLDPAPGPTSGLALYWRNATLGFGQRGLQDALDALSRLPDDVHLHLRGRAAADGGSELDARVRALGLTGRVHVHPPHLPHEAVAAASRFDVGLCLEHDGVANHRLTVSNKLFDYLMAGLAVVVSDLPPLRDVVERSGGGLLFAPGSPEALAGAIRSLYDDPGLLTGFRRAARAFAVREGTREREMARLVAAVRGILPPVPEVATRMGSSDASAFAQAPLIEPAVEG